MNDAVAPDSNAELDALREEIATLRAELARARGSDAESRKRLASELQEELRETLESVREKSQDVLERARASGDRVIDDLEKQIQKQPLLSLLLIFLAGILMAKLFERR